MDFVIDIVEPKEGICFLTGYASKALNVGDIFTLLSLFEPAKKKKQAPKKLSTSPIELTVTTLLVAGEPLESLSSGTSAQVGVTGDTTPLLDLIQLHKWHMSNGRYLLPRNEIRILTLSGD